MKLTKEQEVLFQLLRGELRELPANFDPGVFIRLLQRHKLLPVAEQLLHLVDDETRERWKERLKRHAARSLTISAENIKVIKALHAHGIQAIPMKGAVLAYRLYGDAGQRQYSDIDLLINKSELEAAGKILPQISINKIYPTHLTKRQERVYFSFRKDFGFFNEEKQILIELHFGIYVHQLLKKLDAEELFSKTERIYIQNEQIAVQDEASTFIYLVFHGCLHQFYRLTWLRDVARCLELFDLDHEEILERFQKLGLERMVATALILAEHYFNTEIPVAYKSLISRGGVINTLVRKCHQRITEPENTSLKATYLRHSFFLNLKPGLNYKWMVIWSLLQRWRVRKFMGGH